VLRVSRDGAHVEHAVESGAGEILLRLVREDGAREPQDGNREGRRGRRKQKTKTTKTTSAVDATRAALKSTSAKAKASERRAVASDAADALLELVAVSDETREALKKRAGFVKQVRAASKDVALDAKIRAKLAAFANVAET
jgi:hypothetical protein